jgi:hypothetical protein
VNLPSPLRASPSLHRASQLPLPLFLFPLHLLPLLPRLRRGESASTCLRLLPAHVLPALPSPFNGLSTSSVPWAATNPTTSIVVPRRFRSTLYICLRMSVRS